MGLLDSPLGIVLVVLAVAWIAIGWLALVSPLAIALWLLLGLAVLFVLYSGSVRLIKRGRGDSEW